MAEWAYNPLTGNLDRIGEGGGGGNITISGDSGPPLNGNIFAIVGQEAGISNVPVMSVDTSTGDIAVANNTWSTQYVVDNSADLGLKGTFATLQEAMDAAIADGNASYPMFANILMRPGDYDLSATVFPDGGNFNIFGLQPSLENAGGGVRFNGIGAFTLDAASQFLFQNIVFADVPTFGPNCGNLVFKNVNMGAAIFNCPTALFSDSLAIGGDFTINDTCGSFQSYNSLLYVNFQFAVTTNSGFNFYGHNSSFSGFYGTNVGNFRLFNSKYETLTFAGSSGVDSNNFLINCSNVTINGVNPTPAIVGTGDFYIANLSGYCYNSNPTIKTIASTQGNVINSIVVADDYVATIYDHYIGVSDTSAPRTITLPDPSSLLVRLSLNQSFIVKDQSGNAGTNNITVVSAVGLIDGQASAALTNNYASLTFKSDGANYYII